MRPWLAIGFFVVGGCCFAPGSERPQAVPRAAHEREIVVDPPITDGPILYAVVRRDDALVPARFSAPWPGDADVLASVWPLDAPPRAQVEARLCAGDEAAMRAWADAVARAGGDRERTLSRAAQLTEWCDDPRLCDRGVAMLDAGATGALADVARIAVASCGRDADRARVELEEAPAIAICRWLDARAEAAIDAPPARPERATPLRVAAIGRLLGTLDEDGQPLFDYVLRHSLATFAGLEGGRDALRALVPRLRPHAAELVTQMLAITEGDDGVAARLTIAEQIAEAEACVAVGGWEGRGCLTELAILDRPRAVERARALAGADDEVMSSWAQAVVRFADEGALASRLRGLGLIGDEALTGAATLDAEVALLEARRATNFDTETGAYPNEHDALLATLASLAPGVLDDVVYEEIPPANYFEGDAEPMAEFGLGRSGEPVTRSEDEEGPYLLRAYDRGHRLSVYAENLGDWFDVGAVVGLLNVLARDRRSDVRWVILDTGDQTVTVVAGPERGLRAAIEDGLLTIGSASIGEEASDAEEALIEELIEGGELE